MIFYFELTIQYIIKNLKSCPNPMDLSLFGLKMKKREVTDFGAWSFEQGELLV